MTPILATNYISAKEQIEEGKDGIITENSEEGIYLGLREVLQNKNKVDEFRKNLSLKEYNNQLALIQHRSLFS
jgi:glycosyltransferase involved in cell wall biosynthesis